MIRRVFRTSIGVILFSLFCLQDARAADPSGSGGGQYNQDEPSYQGTTGTYQRAPGTQSPYLQPPAPFSPFPQFPSMTPSPQGADTTREMQVPSTDRAPAPFLPPLPPEGQSGFEQFVSGKVEITRAQFETIFRDPNLRFSITVVTPPPGSILVLVKIVAGPEKAEARRAQQQQFEIEAGYLVGPPDRIGETFRLLGIGSPYSNSTDLKHFGFDLFQQGRSGFQATIKLPVGPDYILGPGDELRITVWGKVEGAWNIEIDRDGTVRGAVASGLNFEASRWQFEGAVRITVPGGFLVSDSATVEFKANRITRADIAGQPAQFEQQRNDQLARGRARRIDYDLASGNVRLDGDAWLTDGRNEINGPSLVYDLGAQRVVANSGQGDQRPPTTI